MTKTWINLSTYIIALLIVGLLAGTIKLVGIDLVLNDNSNLDNESIGYIADINGIDLSFYNVSKDEIENPIYIKANETQGNPKDYSLEFQFTKEKGLSVENKIKQVFGVPSLILFDILKLPSNNWEWLIDSITWALTISITIALILFGRGQKTN